MRIIGIEASLEVKASVFEEEEVEASGGSFIL